MRKRIHVFSVLCAFLFFGGLTIHHRDAEAEGSGPAPTPVIPTYTVNLEVRNETQATIEVSLWSGSYQLSFDRIDFPGNTTTTETKTLQDKNPGTYSSFSFRDQSHIAHCVHTRDSWLRRSQKNLPCLPRYWGDIKIALPQNETKLDIEVTFNKDGMRLETSSGISLHKNDPNYDDKWW